METQIKFSFQTSNVYLIIKSKNTNLKFNSLKQCLEMKRTNSITNKFHELRRMARILTKKGVAIK